MMSNQGTLKSTRQIIQQIGVLFRDQKNPNNINLQKLREHINKDKNLNESHIFKKKLDTLRNYDTIDAKQFNNVFYPNITNVDHFNAVFNELDKDGSGKISKRQLQLYNKQAGLNLSKNDIQLMINFASKDGQKVFKQDLYQFLSSN